MVDEEQKITKLSAATALFDGVITWDVVASAIAKLPNPNTYTQGMEIGIVIPYWTDDTHEFVRTRTFVIRRAKYRQQSRIAYLWVLGLEDIVVIQ